AEGPTHGGGHLVSVVVAPDHADGAEADDHFFFQAEDGIRDFHVTGVQTCALPIFTRLGNLQQQWVAVLGGSVGGRGRSSLLCDQIGRASCRERVASSVAAAT